MHFIMDADPNVYHFLARDPCGLLLVKVLEQHATTELYSV